MVLSAKIGRKVGIALPQILPDPEDADGRVQVLQLVLHPNPVVRAAPARLAELLPAVPRVRLQELVERQHREVAQAGVLDVHQIPEEVARRGVPLAPLRHESTVLQRLPPIHPRGEELEDVADLHPVALHALIRE
eukprot:10147122-Alexandrium_andersonii.AAC.1